MLSLDPQAVNDILQVAQTTLDDMNQEFGTNVAIKVASVQDLRTWGLNPRFAGFVVQEEPSVIWVVPENIRVPEEAVKTIRHEFQHILDLTGSCPFCTAPTRELRALEAETGRIVGRPSPESIQINKAVDEMDAVLGQEIPSDLGVPEECEDFPEFINNSLAILVENAKLLGRLELLEREAARRGPEALRRFQEVLINTRLEVDTEREAILREAVRLAQCMNQVERRRMEERFRELVRPLAEGRERVDGRVRVINEAIGRIYGRPFAVPFRVCGPAGCQEIEEALVDSGSTHTQIPPDIAQEVGFQRSRWVRQQLADDRFETVPLGFLEITVGERSGPVPITVREAMPLIGATTLEILGFIVEPEKEMLRPVDHVPPTRGRVAEFRDWIKVFSPEQLRQLLSQTVLVDGRVRVINEALEQVAGRGSDTGRYKLKLQAVIGELVAAQSHLSHLDPDLAAKIRTLKKRLQLAIWGRMA